MANDRRTATYFVDEAGDLTFFDRRGKLLLGGDGVSHVFIVAAALIADVEVFVAFRRKREVAAHLRAYFDRTRQKLGAEFIYDELVTSIFENRLHLASANHIVFARRGKSNRNLALNNAIALAKRKFDMKWRKGIDRPTTIASSTPSDSAGLQVVDYYLWALQRMIERREDRFFKMLARAYRLVLDRDDMRRKPYGEILHSVDQSDHA